MKYIGVGLLGVVALMTSAVWTAEGWSYVPQVAYEDDVLQATWVTDGPPGSWTVTGTRPVRTRIDGSSLVIDAQVSAPMSIHLQGPDGREANLVTVAPGQSAQLHWTLADGLRAGSDTAVLALPRLEARSDRRWQLIRALAGDDAKACQHILFPPSTISGESALLSQIVACHQTTFANDGVLIVMSAGERTVGWKHREFRQMLAWLVADALARNAGYVVIVQPRVAVVVDDQLDWLRRQVEDVAAAYRCRVYDPQPLMDTQWWMNEQGQLTDTLQPAGQAHLRLLLQPWGVAP